MANACILKGVEAFHNAGICHRDLKTENILVDEKYNLKICDFGFSTSNTGHLKESCGTEGYKAPEVEKENPNYDGIKADIFSLGVVLFTLVTGVNGFDKKNKLYRFIRIRNYDTYWKSVEGALKVFPKDFKELYNRMVCYNTKKRLSVKDILNEEGKKTDYDWLKEIRDLNKDDFASLEEEVKNELKKRKIEVRKGKQKEENKESEDESNIEIGGENKSITDEKVYFEKSRQPKYAENEIYMDNYIKINGNLNPIKFMNDLANSIDENLGDDCTIDVPEKGLKFNITFEGEEKGGIVLPKEIEEELAKLNPENDQENDNLNIKQCILQVKLFKLVNGGHLLRFLKKSGELGCYYEIVEKISKLVKEVL
jgi:serine/threonine protein kinase